jgi:hypothetical protein
MATWAYRTTLRAASKSEDLGAISRDVQSDLAGDRSAATTALIERKRGGVSIVPI